MSDDHELLILAAKGYELSAFVDIEDQNLWTPLRDDGQAFRLAIKLKLLLGADSNHAWAITEDECHSFMESIGENPYKAMRRAIVRAAAHIGSAMS